jgi:putative sterol carrier protein
MCFATKMDMDLMASKEEVITALQKIPSKLEEPKMQKKFKNFDRTLQLVFTDLEFDVIIEFDSLKATIREGSVEEPNLKVITEGKIIVSILDGSLSAMRAFMTGKIKAKGSTRDLLKLQHLLKA